MMRFRSESMRLQAWMSSSQRSLAALSRARRGKTGGWSSVAGGASRPGGRSAAAGADWAVGADWASLGAMREAMVLLRPRSQLAAGGGG